MKVELNDLLNETYWTEAYNRLVSKRSITTKDNECITSLLNNKDKQVRICEEILDGTYKWSVPRKVEIAKAGTKKKRVIYMLDIEDRMISGVLYRCLSAKLTHLISDNCYSYKKGTCTCDAIKEIKKRCESIGTENIYGAKFDIHSYFNSVPKWRLIEMINELFSDVQGLKKTIEGLMLEDEVCYKNETLKEYKGLMPGCALASLFANYCLHSLDNSIKDTNVIYARYSDDIIVISNSKETVDKYTELIKNTILNYELEINDTKTEKFDKIEDINFLGLKFNTDNEKITIDISDHAKQKIKKNIHRWCKKARKRIEMEGTDFETEARNVIKRINYNNFKCYLAHEGTFGWCHYAYRYITDTKSLKELDFYTINTLRYLKTGKHNKANVRKLSTDEIKDLGWVSLVDLYHLYRYNFDIYCDIIDLI